MAELPDVDVPLVADMSSDYLSRPIEWSRFDLVYGGVQKNLAPAGMAVVFVRSAVLEKAPTSLPAYLRYPWHAAAQSLANTPPMFPIYVMGKVLADLERQGGIRALEERSAMKSAKVYAVIDGSEGFYTNPVDPASRSHMNVVFKLPTDDLEAKFVSEATAAGMIGLKGHRSVGGCRASLYAALPDESVDALTRFMAEFRESNG
jgi:phosphoserine aminotransferase